jgi:hypothetical protein
MKHSKLQLRIWLAGIAATLLVAAAGIGFGPAPSVPAHAAGTASTTQAPDAQAPPAETR